MSKNSTTTIIGNAAADPELRFTQTGQPVANFRMAVSDRVRDAKTGEWNDTDPTWYTVVCWRTLAENVAESVQRGNRVMVTGRMQQRSWETDDGETRYAWELVADEVALSLLFAPATAHKAEREKPQPKNEVAAKRSAKSRARKPAAKPTRNAKPDDDWEEEESDDLPF